MSKTSQELQATAHSIKQEIIDLGSNTKKRLQELENI
jgi:hypothetical protein